MAWGKKNKDEVSKKRNQRAKITYKQCGRTRKYTAKGGSIITVVCTKNANVSHTCD